MLYRNRVLPFGGTRFLQLAEAQQDDRQAENTLLLVRLYGNFCKFVGRSRYFKAAPEERWRRKIT